MGRLRVYRVRVSGGRIQPDRDVTFERFFLAEHTRLVAIGLAFGADRETACDAAQEAMARAFANWDRVQTLDQPGPWVRRALINLLIDNHRRQKRELAVVTRMVGTPVNEARDPETDGFVSMVRRLPERQRTAVVLHYLDDLSVDDVAYAMNIAGGTVKSLLFKARRTLSVDLARNEGDR